MQLRSISPADFTAQLDSQDSVLLFENQLFDFPVSMQGNYRGDIEFRNCDFIEEVSLANAHFAGRLTMTDCNFKEDVDWTLASFDRFVYIRDNTFNGRCNFKRTIFNGNVNFFASVFNNEVFFDHTFFRKEASFYKVQFLNNLYVHKAYMGIRADFSYASFSPDHATSFFSIQNSYPLMNGKRSAEKPPVMIFRYIYFPTRTIFNNVDFSHSIFQDCYLIPIIFKNCSFTKIGYRNCFYQETSRTVSMSTDSEMFERIVKGTDQLSIRLDSEERSQLQVADVVNFVHSDDAARVHQTFITWLYRADNPDDLFEKLSQRMSYVDFDEYRKRLEQLYSPEQIAEHGLMAFSFKDFDEYRHWENLEDTNRQMKRSLEESRDWQKAGDFYVGEMNAMIKRLAVRNEKPLYRVAMRAYGVLSGYCESIVRIMAHMAASFAISMLILLYFKSDLGFAALFDANFKLFIPVFGNNTSTLNELGLLPWQNVIMELQVVWYYLLWLFLALTLQRKFKR